MDLYKAIQDLYAEKEKLERVIASLEELQRTAGSVPALPKPVKRRGRKSMKSSGAPGGFRAHAEVLGQPPQAKAGPEALTVRAVSLI